MITSALISQCRRAFDDIPKLSQAAKNADGVSTNFNLGRQGILEGTYNVYYNTSAKVETTDYTLDKDSGDIKTNTLLANGINLNATFKYARFRDAQWVEAINAGIDKLNARGFFRQVTDFRAFGISANVQKYAGPSACVDIYNLRESSNATISGYYQPLRGNWTYMQDSNTVQLGYRPAAANFAIISYLRNLQTYSATSATIDAKSDWLEMLKLAAGEYHFNFMASRIATRGQASIDEGHFSFTNAFQMARQLRDQFDELSKKKKPTRPAKDINYFIPGGGSI